MKKYSIIVPIYNVENYLKRCVFSILNQTYTNFELLLIDDGSTDNCPTICDKFEKKDSRIKVFHKKNGGLVSARKLGALNAIGDYICTVDGDDFIENDYLEKLNDIINDNDVDIVMFDIKRDYKKGISIDRNILCQGYYDRERIENEIFPILIHNKKCQYVIRSICSKAIKKELYQRNQIRIDERITIGEDETLTILTCYEANSIYISHIVPRYHYVQYDYSMTKSKKFEWDYPLVIYNVLKQYINFDLFDFKNQIRRLITHDIFSIILSYFFSKNNYEETANDYLLYKKKMHYDTIINESKFEGIKSKLMKLTLQKDYIFIIYIYAKLKKNF